MEIFIGVAGLIIAWLTFQKTFYSKPDEERNNLLGTFLTTQKLHLEVQSILQKYIDENNGAEHFIYPDITFQHLLNMYKQGFEKDLSDKVYQDLKNNQIYTKSNIATFQKLIDKQHSDLLMFRNQLLFLTPPTKN
ncbi:MULTISPECIES: hypothetical protein [Flavobacterium]|uniref:hypothetical protein n=1 Tax=Flavobacterium TaxID=237 RepID=UPI000F7777E2|nr:MULTISPECIES: hypothetical protein [Flavobacterium]MDP5200223.1 hypothetical protein [Flavobacterium sp. DG2-3]